MNNHELAARSTNASRRRSRARWFAVLLAAGSLVGAVTMSTSATAAPAAATPHAATTSLKFSSRRVSFGGHRIGTLAVKAVVLTNTGTTAITFNSMSFPIPGKYDFGAGTSCIAGKRPTQLAAGATCQIALLFVPHALGHRTGTLRIVDSASDSPQTIAMGGYGTEGYYIAGSRGGVAAFGDAVFKGQVHQALSAPIISITTTSNGNGYWLLGKDGGIFTFGAARFFGSTGGMHLNRPVVGMTVKPSSPLKNNHGYWLVASDGGIFTFGSAKFHGSTGGMHLNQPVVGMASTPTGNGYWLVASDGGIFTFGSAKFYGSTGSIRLAQPIVGMAATPSGKGYWLVARDGGIFAFGDAGYYGSAAGLDFGPVVGMASSPDGHGYWLATAFAAVFKFGNAAYYGDNFTRNIRYRTSFAATAPRLGRPQQPHVFEFARLNAASDLVPQIRAHLRPADVPGG